MSEVPGSEDLRLAMSRYATGVVVATTYHDGHDHAMTANSLTSVSLSPPLVLLCVEHGARFHDAVLACGLWGASILSVEATAAAGWFATRGRPIENQLEGIAHRRGEGNVALLEGALATLLCRTRDVHDGGDHSILVAETVDVEIAADPSTPLVYYRGRFAELA